LRSRNTIYSLEFRRWLLMNVAERWFKPGEDLALGAAEPPAKVLTALISGRPIGRVKAVCLKDARVGAD
jgi:hypothetical protein